MRKTYLAAFEDETDPSSWETSSLTPYEETSRRAGLRLAVLTIASLGMGWNTKGLEDLFFSGASPLEALQKAVVLVREGTVDAVLIKGEEPLKTGYRREERLRLMSLYGSMAIPEAYDLLARAFMVRNGISEDEFREIASALFENYARTHVGNFGPSAPMPGKEWEKPLTCLFRGVDCANPLIDYRGQILVAGAKAAETLAGERGLAVEIAGAGFARLPFDGPENAEKIAAMDHLEAAVDQAGKEAGTLVSDLVLNKAAAFEIYSCYPVIPLAFILKSGMARNTGEVLEIIKRVPLTVTGGMNLARAPWNLPALRGIISVARLLACRVREWGVVHGNGGLGYAQGVAVLRSAE